jgi:predicted lipoprotein with Yx(FWY)xxD motif
MKKGNTTIIILIFVVILTVLTLGYLGRRQIKALLGMSATPAAQTTTKESNSKTQTATQSENNNTIPSNNVYSESDPIKGNFMVDPAGMTLYTYDKDSNGVSNCSGECLKIWPAYMTTASAGQIFPENISIITRSDGNKQFAWKGMPLYRAADDKNPGDTTGDGVGGIWHIVKL